MSTMDSVKTVEATQKTATCPMTGIEYIDSLRDGREVWIYGERVKDVPSHPAFRNTVRMVARLYDALHHPDTKDILTCNTDTGSGGYTQRYFKASRSVAEMVAARDAIAAWQRLTYGWIGRSPDYKASFLAMLDANANFYAPYQENARRWYKACQEKVLYLNHSIVNPPTDRHLPLDEVSDVYVHVTKETDAGLIVSGAKVVATNAAPHPVQFRRTSWGWVHERPGVCCCFYRSDECIRGQSALPFFL